MTDRERFRATLTGGRPDRIPTFDEGIRDDVLAAWQAQGLPADADLHRLFGLARRTEIAPDFEPRPALDRRPAALADLDALRRRLDPLEPARLPPDWTERVETWKRADTILMLRVWRGFFLSMGVNGWDRFAEAVLQLADDPGLVREIMAVYGRFAAALADRILDDVTVDAAVFSEPLGGPDRPLLSPRTYEAVVLPALDPILEVLRRHGVGVLILRTYTNLRAFLPAFLDRGINVLWASETDHPEMDVRRLRREFGPRLGLIGGIRMEALRRGPQAIRREIARRVPPVLAQGRYLPLAAGRVRPEVPYRHYAIYQRVLQQALQS